MANNYGLPSLGTATGTDVDSPAKHIMACKVDTNYFISLLPWNQSNSGDAHTILHTEKMKWCMHKHEVVLCTSKKMSHDHVVHGNVKAYPMVITTVGDMHEITQMIIAHLYDLFDASAFYQFIPSALTNTNFATSTEANMKEKYGTQAGAKLFELKKGIENDKSRKQQFNCIQKQISNMPDFRCQGVALGQAFASHMSGDTVASVFVGGVITVQNGAFPMQTGDMVQWYFDFEEEKFETAGTLNQGRRRPVVPPNETRDASLLKKRSYMDMRTFGTANTAYGQDFQPTKGGRNVVRIKAYKLRVLGPQMIDSFGDKIRIFAKCIGGGRAYDKVDIQICTQSS